MAGVDRVALVREQTDIIRRVTSGGEVEHEGKQYHFGHVSIKPAAPRPIPVWYCGGTPASARLAVDFCDGWMPGRITFPTYEKRVAAMEKLTQETGKAMPVLAAIPITSPGRTRDEAVAKVNLKGLLSNANGQRFWVKPEGGEFTTAEDLAGSFIYGNADDIVASVRRFHAIGNDHLVFDLRFRFDDFTSCLRQLGTEVLPKLRAG